MTKFFTRGIADEGIKFPLVAPDGSTTDEYLVLKNINCTCFRLKEAQQTRRMARELAMLKTDEQKAQLHLEYKRELLATLIKDWSFDEEPTEENKIFFLAEAPQIQEQIDSISARNEYFFKHPSTDSTGSQTSNLS